MGHPCPFVSLPERKKKEMNSLDKPLKFRGYDYLGVEGMPFSAICTTNKERAERFDLLDYKRVWPTPASLIYKSEHPSHTFRLFTFSSKVVLDHRVEKGLLALGSYDFHWLKRSAFPSIIIPQLSQWMNTVYFMRHFTCLLSCLLTNLLELITDGGFCYHWWIGIGEVFHFICDLIFISVVKSHKPG